MKPLTYITLLLSGILAFSCSKMEDMHKEFTVDGPIKYTGKIYPIDALSGKDRVVLKGEKPSDPDAEFVKVYWQFEGKLDSIERKLSEITNPSTSEIEFSIEGLEEGYYTFQILTYDASGKFSSVPVEKGATVYGTKYISSLRAHPIEIATLEANGLKIEWGASSNTHFIENELMYIDLHGNQKTITLTIELGEKEALIEDFMPGQVPKIRSLYLPEPTAVDTFHSTFVDIKIETLFERLQAGNYNVIRVLPRDTQTGEFAGIWDRLLDSYFNVFYNGQSGRQIQYMEIRKRTLQEVTVRFRFNNAAGSNFSADRDYLIFFEDNLVRFEDDPVQIGGANYNNYNNGIRPVAGVEIHEYLVNNSFEVDYYSSNPGVVYPSVRFKAVGDPDSFFLVEFQ